MDEYLLRLAEPHDEPLLWEMLFEAAQMWKDGATSPDEARAHPFLARYLAGWGRPDDVAVVAAEHAGGRGVGAAWLRLLDPDPGGLTYGGPPLPELGIAVGRGARGRGLGERLLAALLAAASPLYPAVELTVRDDNPARRLYERAGFATVRALVNRVGGTSLLMRAELLPDAAARIRLVPPGEAWRRGFLVMAREYALAGERRYDHAAGDFDAFLAGLRSEASGSGRPPGRVTGDTYWAVAGETLAGVIRLRHALTPELEERGGHIGYDVRPALRGRGCATQMLALCLDLARARGMGRVLITCDDDNPASARVIEKNGGMLEDRRFHAPSAKLLRRYWVELRA